MPVPLGVSASECIDTVVFGGDVNHVVGYVIEREMRNIKRLRINLPVHGTREQFAEGVHVDIRRVL
jgi:hypothetical protein